MHQRLKERLVGAAVLVVLAVIFIPMILTGPVDTGSIEETNIPTRPDEKFRSKLVPITDPISTVPTQTSPPRSDTPKSSGAASVTTVSPEIGKEAVTAPVETQTEKPVSSAAVAKQSDKAQEKIQKDKPVGLSAWVVQLGSFASKVNADKLKLSLRKAGFPAFVEPLKQEGKTIYRVRVGPELLRSDADKLLADIKTKMEMEGIVLRYP